MAMAIQVQQTLQHQAVLKRSVYQLAMKQVLKVVE